MNKILILGILGALSVGCVSKPVTRVEARRIELKSCVKEFLHEDVAPMASLRICKVVFKKPTDVSPAPSGRAIYAK